MTRQRKNPAAGRAPDGAWDASRAAARSEFSATARGSRASLTVRLGGVTLTVHGRMAQTLALLIQTGPRGFTAGEASTLGWARRTSHYVRELRQLGFPILTQWEQAGDARVGRYILGESLAVLARCAV